MYYVCPRAATKADRSPNVSGHKDAPSSSTGRPHCSSCSSPLTGREYLALFLSVFFKCFVKCPPHCVRVMSGMLHCQCEFHYIICDMDFYAGLNSQIMSTIKTSVNLGIGPACTEPLIIRVHCSTVKHCECVD